MRTSPRAIGLAALTLTLVGAPAAARTPPGGLAFDVRLSFTPEAERRLTRTGEGVVVDAYWYGGPAPQHRKDADEVGLLRVGGDRRVVEAGVRRLRLRPDAAARVAWLDGKGISVNVNVYSARRTSPDNILSCDAFDDRMERARPGITLRCGLIK